MSVAERYAHLPPLPQGVARNLGSVAAVLSRHPVRLAYLFGSLARGNTQPTDVDLAVLPDAGFSWMALYADLSLHLGTDRLDLVDLRTAPHGLQFEVVRYGRCLYARSAEEQDRFEQRVRMAFRDELPRLGMRSDALRVRVGR